MTKPVDPAALRTSLPRRRSDELSLTRKLAYDGLRDLLELQSVVALAGARGSGKSAIMRSFAEDVGAFSISAKAILEAVDVRDPAAANDSVWLPVEQALEAHDIVVLDNLEMLLEINSTRKWFERLFVKGLIERVETSGCKLVVSGDSEKTLWLSLIRRNHGEVIEIEPLRVEDYVSQLEAALGERVSDIDMGQVYRFASFLNGHDLALLGRMLAVEETVSTARVIEVLQEHVLSANTRTHEVEALSFDRLPGAEHIAAKLETHIILPLENQELATRLDIRPKRGVLLYGPPGTGKTSIGRALAHRMKGRFFLIDGSFVTEPPTQFFARVTAIVREAKENAPSVLFIDDADVLFGIVHISGFSRYLLTLLDGMESASASKICLMMTAMDASKVPEALLRSGRVELWLETRPPDFETRARILERWMDDDMPGSAETDYLALSALAERFTPADLRRVIGDAKALYAADRVAQRDLARAQDYIARAIAALIETRASMANNLRDESLRIGTAAPQGKYAEGIGGVAMLGESCKVLGW